MSNQLPSVVPVGEVINWVDLVRRMRTAQKNFFASHRDSDLQLSRQLEKKVDQALERATAKGFVKDTPTQQNLFGK